MKGMRIGALAVALVATAGAAQAQDATHERRGVHGERHQAGHMAEHMAQELGLSEAQRAQIRAIHERYHPQMQALNQAARTHRVAAREARQRGDTAAARAAMQQARAAMQANREQRQALHTQMRAEVRAILTPEQQTRFDAHHEHMREHMEMRRERRGSGERGFRGERGNRGARPDGVRRPGRAGWRS